MAFAKTPRISYLTMSSYSSTLAQSLGGYMVCLIPIKVDDLPTGADRCSICDREYVACEVSKLDAHGPVALDCGHIYCASCILDRVDFEMDPFQGCPECDPKVSDGRMLTNESGTDFYGGEDNNSTEKTIPFSIHERLRTEEIAKRITITSHRAAEILAGMTLHGERWNFQEPPTPSALDNALGTFNARYGSDLDLDELEAVLALTNMQNGTSITVIEALSPWL
ncbi:MAG: hypothetical protein Q9163_005166 [Psora crenata]